MSNRCTAEVQQRHYTELRIHNTKVPNGLWLLAQVHAFQIPNIIMFAPYLNMDNIACDTLVFINLMCKFICGMLHMLWAMFSFILRNMSWSIYDTCISISLWNRLESMYDVLKNPFGMLQFDDKSILTITKVQRWICPYHIKVWAYSTWICPYHIANCMQKKLTQGVLFLTMLIAYHEIWW